MRRVAALGHLIAHLIAGVTRDRMICQGRVSAIANKKQMGGYRMAEIDTLKEALERLTRATQQTLHLIQKNRVASSSPPAHGYDEMWADTMQRLESIELMLQGK